MLITQLSNPECLEFCAHRLYCEKVKNVTVSLDDETYRNARRRAAENDRSLSSVVREALQSYGAEESEFDRLTRERRELVAEFAAKYPGFDASQRLSRDELYDPDSRRMERRRLGYDR